MMGLHKNFQHSQLMGHLIAHLFVLVDCTQTSINLALEKAGVKIGSGHDF